MGLAKTGTGTLRMDTLVLIIPTVIRSATDGVTPVDAVYTEWTANAWSMVRTVALAYEIRL